MLFSVEAKTALTLKQLMVIYGSMIIGCESETLQLFGIFFKYHTLIFFHLFSGVRQLNLNAFYVMEVYHVHRPGPSDY